MLIIGIDPGLDGAMAILGTEGEKIRVIDVPTLTIASGKKSRRDYNERAMAAELKNIKAINPNVFVALERTHSMPEQGVVAMFNMGQGLGLWRGLLCGLELSYEFITPQRWKSAMIDGQGKNKDASRQVALRLFPELAELLARKKDHNRAEALLIAFYTIRRMGLTWKK